MGGIERKSAIPRMGYASAVELNVELRRARDCVDRGGCGLGVDAEAAPGRVPLDPPEITNGPPFGSILRRRRSASRALSEPEKARAEPSSAGHARRSRAAPRRASDGQSERELIVPASRPWAHCNEAGGAG